MKKNYIHQLEQLYQKPNPAQTFIEATKFVQRVVPPPSNQWPSSWITINFKAYPRLKRIVLPEPIKVDQLLLHTTFEKRFSTRRYVKQPIALETVSTLLKYAVGIKNRKHITDWNRSNRYYASGGARYPNEIYLAVLRVKGLEPGLYHYNFKLHALEIIRLGDVWPELSQCVGDQWLGDVGMVVLMGCVFGRTEVKYHSRGLRHAYIEAGHMGQNLYLWAAALDLGCCGLGGFADDATNNFLRIDGYHEFIINALAIGQPDWPARK